MKFAAINLNLDSLGEAYGFPPDYKDPTFTKIFIRFLEFSRKYNYKYSIYVIGKDLEKEENRKEVKKWAEEGHEIGNHSWSHPVCLGSLSEREIYNQIKKTHDIITETIGEDPKGFIAPGWSFSKKLLNVLLNLDYFYDTSIFPSVLLYPSLIKMFLNYRKDKRVRRMILKRKDFFYPFYIKRKPFIYQKNSKKLICFPLPTNKWRIGCWHTMAFVFGWKIHKKILRSCLKEMKYFYYLVHPADLISPEDLDISREISLERINYDLDYKKKFFSWAIEEILNAGFKLVTMKELAEMILKKINI